MPFPDDVKPKSSRPMTPKELDEYERRLRDDITLAQVNESRAHQRVVEAEQMLADFLSDRRGTITRWI